MFGLVIAFITMMLSASFYRKISFWFLLGAMVMQAATLTPLGVEVNGNKGWIGIPGVFTMQPAEIVKLALCIWMPNELINARKQVKKVGAPRAYSKLIRHSLCAFCLVMSGKDLGTGLIILAIGGIALLLGGFPGKWLAGAALLGICGIVGFILTSPNRLGRIMAAYRTCSPSDLQGVCVIRRSTANTRSHPAACWASASAIPARNGAIFPKRTTISSSPSSARKPDSSEQPW